MIVEPEEYQFADDSRFPNSQLPLLVYRCPLDPDIRHLAGSLEIRFATNSWTNGWRNGVYDYAHFHSTTHEVLGIFEGTAVVQFGGPVVGSTIALHRGDVVVIPAGVAHQSIEASDDFGVVGAYPDGKKWDLLRGLPGERPAADQQIAVLPLPTTDPIYGVEGPLVQIWQAASEC